MENLPPELLSVIFSFACTDSGFTGRSLSLVSRRIRSCSRPYAYQSIYLPRRKHILAFSVLVKQLPEEHRKLRYLHTPCPHLFPARDNYIDTPPMRSSSPSEHRTFNTDLALYTALHSILRATSSSLRVLSLFWVSCSAAPMRNSHFLPEFPLPMLEELHIDRVLRWEDHDHDGSMVPTSMRQPTPVLPNLRRLYIAGDKERDYGPMKLIHELSVLAPRLEHLRIPLYHLEGRISPPDAGYQSQAPWTFPFLKSITVDTGRFASNKDASNNSKEDLRLRVLFGTVDPRYDIHFEPIYFHDRDGYVGSWERRWDDYLNGRIREKDEGPWVIW